MGGRDPVCFLCGSSVETAMENRLPTGEACPTCRDRVLEAQSPLLPGVPRPELEQEPWQHATPWEESEDAGGDDRDPGPGSDDLLGA